MEELNLAECPFCNGRGVHGSPESWDECNECEGTGVLQDGPVNVEYALEFIELYTDPYIGAVCRLAVSKEAVDILDTLLATHERVVEPFDRLDAGAIRMMGALREQLFERMGAA